MGWLQRAAADRDGPAVPIATGPPPPIGHRDGPAARFTAGLDGSSCYIVNIRGLEFRTAPAVRATVYSFDSVPNFWARCGLLSDRSKPRVIWNPRVLMQMAHTARCQQTFSTGKISKITSAGHIKTVFVSYH